MKQHHQHVNLAESSLCGYLHIKGLTEDYPELTTFFEAEIIGRKHSFLTKKWDANDHIDIQHWVSSLHKSEGERRMKE